MDLQLSGRTALVTGGSKGIGFACAKALAAEGCHVRLVARDKAALVEARDALRAAHDVSVEIFEADLSRLSDSLLVDAFPEVDIVVNSAGAIPRGGLLDVDPGALREGFEGKLMGTVALCRAFYRRMRERRRGVILNIIGISGLRPNPKSIGTSSANAALIALTQALGAESVDHGVRVLGVNPGLVRTGRTASLLNPTQAADKAYDALLASLPFGRMAEPAEVADLVSFLVSERASYLSGEVISIDGGSRFRF
ncbi:short-chain dehydrogenase/reductase [Variovorax sp.]|jgi:3-oxoacyl-[acyl-carrier protein] reductase|uniref:short-chain dehydrogenase/reductase n=1 Tax=Variovorax sp. TaxID=1871043 RepID=UPI0040381EFE